MYTKYFRIIVWLTLFVPILATAQEFAESPISKNRQTYYDAIRQKIVGDIQEAITLFEQCLTLEPNDASAMYELAGLYYQQGNLDKALPLAEKAVRTDPVNEYYKLMLVQLYQSTGQYQKAGEVLEALIAQNPKELSFYEEQAVNCLYMGDYKSALRYYNLIEEQVGIMEEISTQKEKIYLMTGKPEKAIAEIQKLVDSAPDETRYLEMLAELYIANGMDEKALEIYKKILAQDPGNPYINISLSDYYRKKGDKDRSFEHLKLGFANPELDIDTKIQILLAYYTVNEIYNAYKTEAFTLAGILVNTHPEDPKAYSIYGDLLLQDKRYAEARDAFRKVISIDSTRYLVWEQLLFAESELNDNLAMASESERALQIFPQQPLLYLFAGASNFQLKEFGKAAQFFRTGAGFVVANDKMLAQFYSYLGDTYFQLKDHQASDEAYERSLAIDPVNPLVLNNFAYYLSLRGENLERALEMAAKSVELDPDNGSNQDTYGWVLFRLGRYEEAKTWIGKAIENREESAVVLEHYGDVLYKLGDIKEAVKYWEKALNLGEGSEFLEKKVRDRTYYE